jgi:hypothetical protein
MVGLPAQPAGLPPQSGFLHTSTRSASPSITVAYSKGQSTSPSSPALSTCCLWRRCSSLDSSHGSTTQSRGPRLALEALLDALLEALLAACRPWLPHLPTTSPPPSPSPWPWAPGRGRGRWAANSAASNSAIRPRAACSSSPSSPSCSSCCSSSPSCGASCRSLRARGEGLQGGLDGVEERAEGGQRHSWGGGEVRGGEQGGQHAGGGGRNPFQTILGIFFFFFLKIC